MWAPTAAGPFLADHLKSLQEYPPRQGADSLSLKKVIEGVMKKMESPSGSGNRRAPAARVRSTLPPRQSGQCAEHKTVNSIGPSSRGLKRGADLLQIEAKSGDDSALVEVNLLRDWHESATGQAIEGARVAFRVN